jgi:type II secretory pathway pseudopilin PulG
MRHGSRWPLLQSEDGVALLVALMAMSMLSVIGLALALSASTDRLAASNYSEATELANAAESALELAVRDLSSIPDWAGVLTGELQSTLVDGPSGGVRQPLPGVTVDLTARTNELTCGRRASCSDAAVRAAVAERPWGDNNPRWCPFLHAVLQSTTPRRTTAAYVVVWIGDDGAEVDGNPLTDGGGPAGEGRYIVRAHAEAFGPGGGRHAIEAELERSCPAVDGCLPGVRVQSWRTVTAPGS